MELQVLEVKSAKPASKLSVNEAAFNVDVNEGLVHQVVVACLSSARQGTKAQKNRAAVSGGGAKPWRQKGTGRARAGTSRGPIWRSGGRAFAAQPRSYKQKINKKMYQAALRSILSELVRSDRLVVVDSIDVEQPKTKELVSLLNGMQIEDVLIVSDAISENLYLSARNLYNVGLCSVYDVDPVSLLAYKKVMMTQGAIKHFEEYLG